MNRRCAEITVLPLVVVGHTLLLSASTDSIKAGLSHLERGQCSIFCNQSKRWCQEELHFVYLPPGHYSARLMSKSSLIAAGKAAVICLDDVEENEVPLKADHTAVETVCSCPWASVLLPCSPYPALFMWVVNTKPPGDWHLKVGSVIHPGIHHGRSSFLLLIFLAVWLMSQG